MHFDLLLLRWAFWTLLIALILGGKPWVFPKNGKYWIESEMLKAAKEPESDIRSGPLKTIEPLQQM